MYPDEYRGFYWDRPQAPEILQRRLTLIRGAVTVLQMNVSALLASLATNPLKVIEETTLKTHITI